MRIDALDDLAIELNYEPQDTVGRRVLSSKLMVKLRTAASAMAASRRLNAPCFQVFHSDRGT